MGNRFAGPWKEAVRGGIARWYPNLPGCAPIAAEVDDEGWRVWRPTGGASYYDRPDEHGTETGRGYEDGIACADAALRRLGGLPSYTTEMPDVGVWSAIPTNNAGQPEPVRILSSEDIAAMGWGHGVWSTEWNRGRLWALRWGRKLPYLIPDETGSWLFWPIPINLPPPPQP